MDRDKNSCLIKEVPQEKGTCGGLKYVKRLRCVRPLCAALRPLSAAALAPP